MKLFFAFMLHNIHKKASSDFILSNEAIPITLKPSTSQGKPIIFSDPEQDVNSTEAKYKVVKMLNSFMVWFLFFVKQIRSLSRERSMFFSTNPPNLQCVENNDT